MTILVDTNGLAARRAVAAGPLAPLTASLRRDLAPAIAAFPAIPEEKAHLTRSGGRCAADGALLSFDPFRPAHHACPRCARSYTGEAHDRFRLMWQHLWLAERAVHGASLLALDRDASAGRLAEHILDGYAERYLRYPNRDNALGPSRPFFSTYLESIWSLQLAVALDLLELAGHAGALAGRVRDRILEPSLELITSFDEGPSNRQVWNAAAAASIACLLDRPRRLEEAILGETGIAGHLAHGLLSDGSWYEGENYHLFAHRGLWYGVTIADSAGIPIPRPLLDRFDEGFATPFLTALPDFTFPARRDSQYAVSLRQWRVAESAELGLARRAGDARLRAALAELYREDVAEGDTGRARSTAEAERNEPPARLTRADLGWRSLLRALAELPPLGGAAPRSALLEGQGLAVIRRERGRVYVALDYGHSGGGHGHPDRLNLLLADGATRWLDDVGTGSYVERTLHWYRSTLAHNAPLVDGRSQARVSGRLRAYEERDVAAWVDAEAVGIAPGVVARRAVVVLEGYVVDELAWTSDAEATVDLPAHVDAEAPDARWVAAPLPGGGGLEDGFEFLADAQRDAGSPRIALRLRASAGASELDLRALAEPGVELWRAVGPGPPGAPPAPFIVLRQRGRAGRIRMVWSLRGTVREVDADGGSLVVSLADGTRHSHERVGDGWRIAFFAGAARSTVDLGGERPRAENVPPSEQADTRPQPVIVLGRLGAPLPADSWLIDAPAGSRVARFALGRRHYRRTEESWREAGAPRATVVVGLDPDGLVVEADVRKLGPLTFVAAGAVNEFDNEHPDVDGDGLQLYLSAPSRAAGEPAGWRVVPVPDSRAARVAPVAGLAESTPPPTARWGPTPHGYRVQVRVPLVIGAGEPFRLDLAVNEKPPERTRRRGQLLLSGGDGAFLYLQGDRVTPSRWHLFRLDA